MGRSFISQKKQTKEEMFHAVVKNAIDFIDASIDDLDKRPKNGIVDFYTAIELFLKARLMEEHWTLILAKPDSANLQSFSVGDFHSVYLEEAAKRLKDILGDPIPESALKNFKTLGEHRNQIVHFSHTDYTDAAGTKAGVVVEQWHAWYYLYELLTNKWKSIFIAYQEEIERLNNRMMRQKEFIQARYKELEKAISDKVKAGATVVPCNNCLMKSGIATARHAWGIDYQCEVCHDKGTVIRPTNEKIPCNSCGNEFEFFNKELTACPHCGESMDTDKLISLCKKKYTEGDAWWEEGAPHIAHCHSCEHPKPSVFYIDGMWSCVSCFDRGWQATCCPHCDEFVTGDMERIKYFACFKCEDERRREILAGSM